MKNKDKKTATPEIEREIYDLCYRGKLGLASDIRRASELFRAYTATYIRIGEKAVRDAEANYRKSITAEGK